MAYLLGKRERVLDGVRRVVIEELNAAAKSLRDSHPSSEKRIHAARKSVKKVRAILAAIDAAGGRGITRSGRRLCEVNRALSPLRDLDAMTKTLGTLREIYPKIFSEHAFGRIRRNLSLQRQRAFESTRTRGLWKRVNQDLHQLRHEVLEWRTAKRGFRYWSESAIFVTEDDSQDGLDHANGHRTVGLAINTYVRHGIVESNFYTIVNMYRTIEQILGLSPRNQFDLAAEPMFTTFTSKTEPDSAPADMLNRAIWHSVKGFNTPYNSGRPIRRYTLPTLSLLKLAGF